VLGSALLAVALAASPQNLPAPADAAQSAAAVRDDAPQSAEEQVTAPVESDATLNRLAVRLSRPQRIHFTTDQPLPEPTFRIEIRQHPYFTDVPFIWTFQGGGAPLTAPGLEHMGGSMLPQSFGKGGTDILPLFTSLKRGLDEHAARAEIQKALAEFCATHICVLPR
jgi:hypothetical protein